MTGSGSTDFTSYVNPEAIRVVRSEDGYDVTPLLTTSTENGTVTVTPFVPAPVPVVPTATVEAPSWSKPFDGTAPMEAGLRYHGCHR